MTIPPPFMTRPARRVTPHAAERVVFAFLLIFLLSGLASWLLYIRPAITELEQATPFKYGQTTQVAPRGDSWCGSRIS